MRHHKWFGSIITTLKSTWWAELHCISDGRTALLSGDFCPFFGNTKKYDFIGNVWSIKVSQYVLKSCHNKLQSYHVKSKTKWSPSNKGGQISYKTFFNKFLNPTILNKQHKLVADSFQLFLSNHTAILEQRKQNLMFANMQPHHFEHCTAATCPNHKSFWFITPALNFLLKNLVWVMISIERGATSQFTATCCYTGKNVKKNISELGSLGIPISLVRTYIKRNSNGCIMHALCTLLIQSRVLFSLLFFGQSLSTFFCQSLLSYLVHLVIF